MLKKKLKKGNSFQKAAIRTKSKSTERKGIRFDLQLKESEKDQQKSESVTIKKMDTL